MKNPYAAQVLLAIWQRGPLLLEQLHETVPEPEPLELVRTLIFLRWTNVIHLNDGPVDPLYEPGRDEVSARQMYAYLSGEPACKVCHCTDNWKCPEGCNWAAPELCSACAEDQVDVGNATGPRNYNTERGIINRYLGPMELE